MNSITILRPATTGSTNRGALAGAVRSEWIKLRSVRSNAVLVGMAAVVGVAMSLMLGLVVKTDPYDHLPFTIGNTFVVSSFLTAMLAIVGGILLFTSEVNHGTLAVALTARPSKPTIVAAKAVVAAGLGLVMGAVGLVGGLLGGMASGMDVGDTSGAAAHVGWALAVTTMAPLFGLGVGMIVRHSAAAVTIVLVWALAIENIVGGFASPSVSRFMPFSTVHGMLGTRGATDTAESLSVAFSSVGNAGLFACYAGAVMVIGTALWMRQDS